MPARPKPPGPEAQPQRRVPPRPSRSAAIEEPEAPTAIDASTLAAETDLLEQARAELHGADPAAALRLLDRHAAEFPRGLLANERRTTRVRALCQQGRRADAEREAGGDAAEQVVQAIHDGPVLIAKDGCDFRCNRCDLRGTVNVQAEGDASVEITGSGFTASEQVASVRDDARVSLTAVGIDATDADPAFRVQDMPAR